MANLEMPLWPEEAPVISGAGLNNVPEGILGGWRPQQDWTLEASGLHTVFDPETIAGIDLRGSDSSMNQVQARNNQSAQYVPDLQTVHLPDEMPPPVAGRDPKILKPSDRAADFIKSWEQGPDGGPALTQYPSPEGGADTIGWGHKIRPGEDFSKGLTKDQADQLFARDLSPAEKLVQARVKVPLSQQQYDALVSLAFNVPSALDPERSTLLGELNNYDYDGAGGQYFRWNMAGSPPRAMSGLSDRRAGEWNCL